MKHLLHWAGMCLGNIALLAALTGPASAQAFISDRITVTAQGQGEDIILIPGLGSSPAIWEELLEAVPGYRYHLVQVAGFAGAPSAGNGEGPVLAPVAQEVARYIREAGLVESAIIGHSMGGTVGLMIAARNPELVSHLLVVDVPPFTGVAFLPPGAPPETLPAIVEGIAAQMFAADEATRRAQAAMQSAAMTLVGDRRPLIVRDTMASDAGVVARAFQEQALTDLGPELPRIIAETVVLYVTPAGAPFPDEFIDAWFQEAYAPLPGVKVKRAPNSAHFIMWDQPELFYQEVRSLIRSE